MSRRSRSSQLAKPVFTPPPLASASSNEKVFADHLRLASNHAISFFSQIKQWGSHHFRIVLGIVGVLAVILAVLVFLFLRDVPSPQKLSSQSFPVSTKILDRNGKLLYEFYADKNRTPIVLKDLPPYVAQASVA